MIVITRDESLALRDKFGQEIRISITNRNKHGGRKKYYMPEEPHFVKYLEKLRGDDKTATTRQ